MGVLTDREILTAKLSGNYEDDRTFLRAESERLTAAGDFAAATAATELITEILPDDVKEEVQRLMYIDGIRLDIFHSQMLAAMNEGKPATAIQMGEQLYKKISECYVNDGKSRFVCLRNPFEEVLYQLLFKPAEILNKAPFDFTRMLTDYAFMLLEMQHADKSAEVLVKAIEYNPVDCGAKFELAEVYKFSRSYDLLIKITRETLAVASSPYALARCYCNIGFLLNEKKQFADAAIFYYTSLLFAPNPNVEGELTLIARRTGKPIKPPANRIELNAAFERHGFQFGANRAVLEITEQMAWHEIRKDNIKTALMYLKILYGLTNDPEVRDKILEYEPDTNVDDIITKDQ